VAIDLLLKFTSIDKLPSFETFEGWNRNFLFKYDSYLNIKNVYYNIRLILFDVITYREISDYFM
jgi:hypothetical protein